MTPKQRYALELAHKFDAKYYNTTRIGDLMAKTTAVMCWLVGMIIAPANLPEWLGLLLLLALGYSIISLMIHVRWMIRVNIALKSAK